MEITQHQTDDGAAIRVRGRLDGSWSDQLGAALDKAVRGGVHHVRLDLSEVTFLSSAGIRVLLRYHNQLKAIRGSLGVVQMSEPVRTVLDLMKLTPLLAADVPTPTPSVVLPESSRLIDTEHGGFIVYSLAAEAAWQCRLVGDPNLVRSCDLDEAHCRKQSFPAGTFALGLGALGPGFADCRGCFGEFLAAGGAAAYQPTDGTNVADYLLSAGEFVPDVQVGYGLVGEGTPANLVHFEAKDETAVSLSELAAVALDVAGTSRVGLLAIVEAAGLVGAALRRSPVGHGAGADLFLFPHVRQWLTFTAERAFTHSVALVAGFVVRGEAGPLGPFVRPLGGAAELSGHFHAAAFSYQPVSKAGIAFQARVAELFERQTLLGVLHLLCDDRHLVGAGESEFLRGACWLGPIQEISS